MDWQSIETAPRDGSKFLAARGHDLYLCHWSSLFLRGIDGKEQRGWVRSDGPPGNVATPTHWMPLPAPPALSQE